MFYSKLLGAWCLFCVSVVHQLVNILLYKPISVCNPLLSNDNVIHRHILIVVSYNVNFEIL